MKKKRPERREKLRLLMGSREMRRHPEKYFQVYTPQKINGVMLKTFSNSGK